jgi:hypothetical protein
MRRVALPKYSPPIWPRADTVSRSRGQATVRGIPTFPLWRCMMVFGLVLGRAPKSNVSGRRVRLGLEALEARDVPSTLMTSVEYLGGRNIAIHGNLSDTTTPGGQVISIWGKAHGSATTDSSGNFTAYLTADGLGAVYEQTPGSNQVETDLTDTAPVIDQFFAMEGPDHMWTFRGHVSYNQPNPFGLVINFGGQPVSLSGQTANVAPDGTFTFSIQLNGGYTDNGAVTAQTTDAWGNSSNIAMCCVYQMYT